MTPGLHIRRATADDLPALAEVYTSAVRGLGPTAYAPAQVDAWASSAQGPKFADFILRPATFVAQIDGTIVGFAGVESDGHVASVNVRHGFGRRGIGTRLLEHLIAHVREQGITRLHAETSVFSEPLFVKVGFIVTGFEDVTHKGVAFRRGLVEMRLGR